MVSCLSYTEIPTSIADSQHLLVKTPAVFLLIICQQNPGFTVAVLPRGFRLISDVKF